MCSYLGMEIITELEEEFSAKRGTGNLAPLEIKTHRGNFCLDEATVGLNFILGRRGNRVYFFPNHSISEVTGLDFQHFISESLEAVLAQQKQPVKLQLSAGEETRIAWLLNVERNWMRVAGQEGVLWMPFERLFLAETDLILAGQES